jgi:hypothetical protein
MHPDLFIIGGAKCGTTSLFDWLSQHPAIFAPLEKEPRYYAFAEEAPDFRGPGDRELMRKIITQREAYEALYAKRGPQHQRALDASAVYLWSEKAPAALARAKPDARLVVLLRQPADRAYSQWLHLTRNGHETHSFAEGLARETQRASMGWSYLWRYRERSHYAPQLNRWLRHFPRAQLQVELFDDLQRDPLGVIQRVLAHAGLDPAPINTTQRSNDGLMFRSPQLARVLSRAGNLKQATRQLLPRESWAERAALWLERLNHQPAKPTIAPDVRRALTASAASDIADVEHLLGRDLSGWRA